MLVRPEQLLAPVETLTKLGVTQEQLCAARRPACYFLRSPWSSEYGCFVGFGVLTCNHGTTPDFCTLAINSSALRMRFLFLGRW